MFHSFSENNSLISAKTSVKTLFTCLIAAFILALFMLMPQESYASSFSNPTAEVTDYASETPGGTIYAQSVDGSMYLFLPREADTQNITLRRESSPESTVLFSVNESESDTLDLSGMTPTDSKYTLQVHVYNSSAELTDAFDLTIMKGNAAGTIYYYSDNKSENGRSWVDASKSHRGTGRAIVYDASGNNLTKNEKNQIVDNIHGRGDSTWFLPKKSYQIKFDKKVSLIDGAGKEKKWVMLAVYKDPLRMKDKIAKDMAALASPLYSPKETWYNFYYDGEYRGLYLISEKNEIKENRINIHDMEDDYEATDPDYGNSLNIQSATNAYGNSFRYQYGLTDTDPEKPGGFVLEMDRTIDENNGFIYTCNSLKAAVNLKSPNLGSRTAVQYISEYFQEFCDAVAATDDNGSHTGRNPATGLFYYDYCDLDSLVDTYLLNCTLSNFDAFIKSQYFYKDCGKKMIAGPVWDYDVCLGVGKFFDMDPDYDPLTSTNISKDLIQIPSFRQKLKDRYQEFYAPILDSLISTGELLPSFAQTLAYIRQDLSMENIIWTAKWKDADGLRTYNDSTTPEEILDVHVNWLSRHKSFLDNYFGSMDIPDSEMHIYGDFVPLDGTVHQRTCIYHPDETITEDCSYEYVNNGDGTHTGTCTVCGGTITKACSCKYVNNGDGTHTSTCTVCGGTITEDCSCKYVNNGNGTHTCTCTVCGNAVTSKHTYENPSVKRRATLTKTGLMHETCICGASGNQTIPKLKTSAVTINQKTVTAKKVKALIAKVEASGGSAATIILGKNVRKIKGGAFASTPVKNIIIKTKKLTKKSVKSSLKDSSVTAIKVSIGSKKTNTSYVKKYKKFFTAKNAGRKVKVIK